MAKYEAYFSNHNLPPCRPPLDFPRPPPPPTTGACEWFLHFIKFVFQFKLVIWCCLIELWNCFISFFLKKHTICLNTDEIYVDKFSNFLLENYRELLIVLIHPDKITYIYISVFCWKTVGDINRFSTKVSAKISLVIFTNKFGDRYWSVSFLKTDNNNLLLYLLV